MSEVYGVFVGVDGGLWFGRVLLLAVSISSIEEEKHIQKDCTKGKLHPRVTKQYSDIHLGERFSSRIR